MPIQPKRRLITVPVYHRMIEHGILREGERLELIKGEIFEMTAIGSEHAGKVNRILRKLGRLLDDELIIAVQNPIYLNDLSEPEPHLEVK